MRLSSSCEMNPSKPPNDCVMEVRDVNLSEMEINLLRSVSPRHTPSIDDRQV